MSPKVEDFPDRDKTFSIGGDEDFILIRVTPEGEVTSFSTLDEEDAVDLLRQTADEIEEDGFDRHQKARLM